jgi:hypothetical protein
VIAGGKPPHFTLNLAILALVFALELPCFGPNWLFWQPQNLLKTLVNFQRIGPNESTGCCCIPSGFVLSVPSQAADLAGMTLVN